MPSAHRGTGHAENYFLNDIFISPMFCLRIPFFMLLSFYIPNYTLHRPDFIQGDHFVMATVKKIYHQESPTPRQGWVSGRQGWVSVTPVLGLTLYKVTTFQTTLNSRLFPDFTSGDSNITFDERFNDNITYPTACFIHEQKKHQLCFNGLLCHIVGKEKPLKISDNILF